MRNKRQGCWFCPLLLLAVCSVIAAAQETELDEGQTLLESLSRDRAAIRELEAEVEKAQGEDLRVAERRLRDRRVEALQELEALVDFVTTHEQEGNKATKERRRAEEILGNVLLRIGRFHEQTLNGSKQ